MFLPQEIIRKKRDGSTLTDAELQSFFNGFLQNQIADYQVAAMLMAIFYQGLNAHETACLTNIMRNSGIQLSWDFPRQLIVDKHSTGGIGDKTSIVILPLAVLAGLKVPMIAGRGLGHTGGTLDKLEAVGFDVFRNAAAVRRQMEAIGGVFMGQTEALVPLDRRLYAMRDVTATVDSIALIVGSILSKKLAAGLGSLVMDVKFGSGAFMRTYEDAHRLAEALVAVGSTCGLNMRCLLTSMNQPLGSYAGNALEIYECLEVLRGAGPEDTRELCLALTTEMVHLAHPERQVVDIRHQLATYLDNGTAYETFGRIAHAQGADCRRFELDQTFFSAPIKVEVRPKLDQGTIVHRIDTRQLGLAIIELGGGRRLVTDAIDPNVGLSQMKHIGDDLAAGEPLAIIHARDSGPAQRAAQLIAEAYHLGVTPMTPEVLIRGTIS